MAVAYVLSMFVYFVIRKKWSHAKYAVEVLTVLGALLFSVIVKMFITYDPSSNLPGAETIGGGFANFLYAIYSAFGFLTFQGMEGFSELDAGILQCLYSGSSLYAGIMFVSVITAKASYEIYCLIRLWSLRLVLKFSRKTDVFLFTAVTEEALLLANDVCKNEIYAKKKRTCKIIFSGDSLGAFDRSNSLHREIMANGYLYWSYSKKDNAQKEKSMLKRLGLYVKNDYLAPDSKKAKKENRIHIFSLNKNERLSGLESENADIVFQEIKAIARESESAKEKPCKKSVIDFYVLTDTAINYEFYNYQLEKIAKEFNKQNFSGKELDEHIAEYKRWFQLHIVNEALIAGKCMAQERIRQLDLLTANQPNPDNFYRAMVLGFGDTGREALKTLYVDSAYVNDNGEPSQFIADVYDTEMDKIAGLYSLSHPLVLCRNCIENVAPVDFKPKEINYGNVASVYAQRLRRAQNDNEPVQTFDDVVRFMRFPMIGFHKVSCFDLQFTDCFIHPENLATTVDTPYNALIITLGEDERNIAMANSLIDGFKHTLTAFKTCTPLSVYVHLRDEKNYNRINWTESEAEKYPCLKVIKFGNRKNIYSYKHIIDVTEDVKYNYGYGLLENKASSVYVTCTELSNDDSDSNCAREFINLQGEIRKDEAGCITPNWLGLSMFKKESNAVASRFGAYFHEILTNKPITASLLKKLTRWEHERWNRFHVANGWTYADYNSADETEKENRRRNKEHNYLCPFDMLSKDVQKNDLVNVALAYKERS